MIRRAFGVGPDSGSAVLVQASPATHVSAGDPPFLIVQGTDDEVVPETQSENFAAQLRADDVPVQLVLVDGGRHGLETPGENPPPPTIAALITSYLVDTLHD
jgi:dipeptidyl aminopeptidase/acylaminoacyl peptidase